MISIPHSVNCLRSDCLCNIRARAGITCLLCVIALSLAGCGGDSPVATATTPTPVTTVTPDALAPATPAIPETPVTPTTPTAPTTPTTPTTPATPATPTTPAPSLTPAGVADFTTLDLGVIANYAAPVLPVYYDATVAAFDNTPTNNAINNRMATLGRVLFYDKRLSINDTISCASCHIQASGFSDPRRFSVGFAGALFTLAHSMRLGNVRFFQPGTMFWNKRATSVEDQAIQPIINSVEMGFVPAVGGITAAITKMQATTYYPDLFVFAFGDSTITETRMQQALAQFVRSMISFNSRWDTAYAQVFSPTVPNRALGVSLPGFTPQEDRGRHLFMLSVGAGGAGCASCHVPPTFALSANSQGIGPLMRARQRYLSRLR